MSAKVTTYPLNPNCSNLLISKGKENFIYFYYRQASKRKQIKFKQGLNDPEITKSIKDRRTKALYNEIHDLLKSKVFNGKTFEDKKQAETIPTVHFAIDTYISSRKPYVEEKTIENYEVGLKFFKNYLTLKGLSELTIDKIDALMIEDYIGYMLRFVSPKTKRPLTVKTVNEYKDRLAFLLNFWTKKKRVLPYSVMEDVNTGKALKSQDSLIHKAMTVEEFQEVVAYVKQYRKPPYLTFLLLIYYAHMRPKEICRLQLKDFDMQNRVINLIAAKSKTRVERIITIDPPLYHHLTSTSIDFNSLDHQSDYFISYSKRNRIGFIGKRMYNHDNISYSFKTMMADLGMEDRGFTKYGLKHTANVHEIVYENMSFAEVQVKNGHTMERQTQTYLRNLKDFVNSTHKIRVLDFGI
ncbi:MAG: tyrosine-type recombinase/integrase [Bacteroidota bacterium]